MSLTSPKHRPASPTSSDSTWSDSMTDATALFKMRRLRHRWVNLLPWMVVLAQCLVLVLVLVDPTKRSSTGGAHCSLATRLQEIKCRDKNQSDEGTDMAELRRMIKTSLSELSNVDNEAQKQMLQSRPKRLFYNRVPKCGSMSLLDLMIEMSQLHNFTVSRAPEYMRFYLDEHWQRSFVQRVAKEATPVIYERHLHFVDFRRYGVEQPVYFNLIRNPMDRLVSWYYFRRYQEGHIRDMPLEQRVRTYDECVFANLSECISPQGHHPEEGYFKIIPFFCGQEDFCREPTDKALVQAIRNVKEHFLVVGISDMYPEFIATMEHILPSYFTGATRVYQVLESEWKKRHRTVYKLPVSKEATNLMAGHLRLEYQFYYFVRNRFRRQWEEIAHTLKRNSVS